MSFEARGPQQKVLRPYQRGSLWRGSLKHCRESRSLHNMYLVGEVEIGGLPQGLLFKLVEAPLHVLVRQWLQAADLRTTMDMAKGQLGPAWLCHWWPCSNP